MAFHAQITADEIRKDIENGNEERPAWAAMASLLLDYIATPQGAARLIHDAEILRIENRINEIMLGEGELGGPDAAVLSWGDGRLTLDLKATPNFPAKAILLFEV